MFAFAFRPLWILSELPRLSVVWRLCSGPLGVWHQHGLLLRRRQQGPDVHRGWKASQRIHQTPNVSVWHLFSPCFHQSSWLQCTSANDWYYWEFQSVLITWGSDSDSALTGKGIGSTLSDQPHHHVLFFTFTTILLFGVYIVNFHLIPECTYAKSWSRKDGMINLHRSALSFSSFTNMFPAVFV